MVTCKIMMLSIIFFAAGALSSMIDDFNDLKREIPTLADHEIQKRLKALRAQNLAAPPRPHQDKIDHFVVLLMENHAADNGVFLNVKALCRCRSELLPVILYAIGLLPVVTQSLAAWDSRATTEFLRKASKSQKLATLECHKIACACLFILHDVGRMLCFCV